MYIILLNPVSGNHKASDSKQQIKDCMRLHNKKFKIIEFSKDGSHKSKIRKFYDEHGTIFVAAGGDGTVSELITILHDVKPIIGIIPLGSANSLARELGIPLGVHDACTMLLTSTKTHKLGVMVANERIYTTDISVGINALVVRDTSRAEKRIFGIGAYIKNIYHRLSSFKPRQFTITIDGKQYKRKGSEVVVANGGILKGLLKRVAGITTMNRNTFEVVISKTKTPGDYIRYFFSYFVGDWHKEKSIEIIRSKKTVTIETMKPLPVQGDGEIIGTTPVKITIHNRFFTAIIPELQ